MMAGQATVIMASPLLTIPLCPLSAVSFFPRDLVIGSPNYEHTSLPMSARPVCTVYLPTVPTHKTGYRAGRGRGGTVHPRSTATVSFRDL